MGLSGGLVGNGVLVVGELLADIAVEPAGARGSSGEAAEPLKLAAHPGGSPANVAVGLARLGVPARFAGRVATTGLGPWLRAHLAANGVDLTHSVHAAEQATLALVTVAPDGGASYGFYGPGTADWQWSTQELPQPGRLGGAGLRLAAVHTGSLAAALGPGAEVIGAWLANVRAAGDVVVTFDPNTRFGLAKGVSEQRRRLLAAAATAHIIKASHEDVEALFPGASLETAAQGWLAQGAFLVLVTQGARAAYAFHRGGKPVNATPPSVRVLDTIGAGDSFMSGFLAFLHQRQRLSVLALASLSADEITEGLSFALAASALTCTRAGADPPWRRELEEFSARLTKG